MDRFKTELSFLSDIPDDRIRTIRVSRVSPTLFELNPKVLAQIQDNLLTSKDENSIKIHFQMSLDEEDGIKSITKTRGLTHEQVMTLYTIFSCRSSSNLRINQFISRFLRVIAGDKDMVVEVNTSDKKQEDLILNDFILSAVCETNTDTPYIKYFEVYSPELAPNSKTENDELTLNIIGRPRLWAWLTGS